MSRDLFLDLLNILADRPDQLRLLGKGGEEINRIRSVTGAAIDAERDEKKPQFKLRGSKEAVCISPISPLYLPYISAARQQGGGGGRAP